MQFANGDKPEPGANRHGLAGSTEADAPPPAADADAPAPEAQLSAAAPVAEPVAPVVAPVVEPALESAAEPVVEPIVERPRSDVPAEAGGYRPRHAMVPSAAVALMPLLPQRRHAPVFSRADLIGAVSMASVLSLTGLPLGWLWSRLAPAQLSVVQQDGALAALPIESQHRFDDLATFVMLGAVAGLLAGLAVWFMRQRRGPLALVGLAVGSLVAGWLAVRTGVSFAGSRYADAIREATPGAVVPAAPRLESAWVLIAQPLTAVLVYGIAAAANGLEDLGRRLT